MTTSLAEEEAWAALRHHVPGNIYCCRVAAEKKLKLRNAGTGCLKESSRWREMWESLDPAGGKLGREKQACWEKVGQLFCCHHEEGEENLWRL